MGEHSTEPAAAPSTPRASSDDVRQRMQRQRTRDTAPELALRRALHARGLRYRVDTSPLKGVRRRADVVFGPARVAVFVDGCFWHACPLHGLQPKANSEWWRQKLDRNKARDLDTDSQLRAAGWEPVRVWEHESADEAAERVARVVAERRPRPSGS